METKEKIVEALEGKRAKQVWELIEKVYLKVFKNTNKKDLETAKEEYLDCEDDINNEKNRYILIEHYNLNDGFYYRYYEDIWSIKKMFEDYFSDCDGGWEEILLIDMKKMKCYLLNKNVSYDKEEVKIKK